MIRSKVALRFAMRTLFERSEKCYFWTFTFRECLDVKVAMELWEKFRKSLWKYGLHPETGEQTIIGLRCFELHPGGHGLHIHAVFNRRICIHAIRRRAVKYGMGWVKVVRVREGSHALDVADYISKYVSKEQRPGCLKGCRLWAAIGKWGATRCKDVEVESEFVAAYHARRRVVAAERSVAELEGRKYRVESQMETLAWARVHVVRVATGRAGALRPDLIRYDGGETARDWQDWDGAFSELTRSDGFWLEGDWVDETLPFSRVACAPGMMVASEDV